ncbi:pentatricopeptide repeat-containing protein At2g20540-like [Aristolochia californica]|uniref:pentatricopeptide repeat-containing protein At2g20540-like n=1 Tax=Aristolochia californica TaxID=171875 RepID=UPI0035D78479
MLLLKSFWGSQSSLSGTISTPFIRDSVLFCSRITTTRCHSTLYEQLLHILTNAPSLSDLKRTHSLVTTHQLLSKSVLACRLLSAYSSLSRLVDDAKKLFDNLPKQTVHTYNHMMKAYIDHKCYKEALLLYLQLLTTRDILPNHLTFSFIIQASIALGLTELAKIVHGHVLVSGVEPDLHLATSLMDFHIKCGSTDYARVLFDRVTAPDVFVWTVMINGYLRTANYHEALSLFTKMKETCKTVGLVTWNSLLAGFVHGGLVCEAWREFKHMQENGVRPDNVSLCTILSGLSQFAVLKTCLEAHAYVIRMGFDLDLFVVSALVDFYVKCGSLASARWLFDGKQVKDTGLWNAMILGYGIHGHCKEALQLFNQMQASEVKPNGTTFTCLLSACSHTGMVTEGCRLFNSMVCDYGILPFCEHYTCMVDMFGRAGRLNEAYEFIKSLPVEPSRDTWGAFLSACRIHNNFKLAETAGEHILNCNDGTEEAGYHVMMSNIYAETRCWSKVAKMRSSIRDERLNKRTGFSWIEIRGLLHTFYIADMSHPQTEDIHSLLKSLEDVAYCS